MHDDPKEEGTNFQGKYERNCLEVTAVHAWLFTDFFWE